ncbi:G protein-coupled receptor, rhodopsin-like [Sergentomyia squamirostris]
MDESSFIVSGQGYENYSREVLRQFIANLTQQSPDSFANLTFLRNVSDAMTHSSRDPMSVVIPITVCYAVIFLAGVLGNFTTCTVISRNKSMHTATNFYLFNLAVSDLLLLVWGMPAEIFNMWYPAQYPFNQSFCILQGLLSETSANATVLTITSFTVERYIAICHPFRQHTMSKLSRAVKFILAIWIVAFCLAIPQAFQFGIVDVDSGSICTVSIFDYHFSNIIYPNPQITQINQHDRKSLLKHPSWKLLFMNKPYPTMANKVKDTCYKPQHWRTHAADEYLTEKNSNKTSECLH